MSNFRKFIAKMFGSKSTDYIHLYDCRQVNESFDPLERKLFRGELANFIPDNTRVLEVWQCVEDIMPSNQLVNGQHQFIVFKTENLFFSLEKNTEGVILQISNRQRDVATTKNGKPRHNPGCLKKIKIDKELSLGSFFFWLYKTGVVDKKYNILFSNGFNFVDSFIDKFCTSKSFF